MLNDSLGYLLNTSARLIKRDLDSRLRNFGLTSSQWAVLNLLSSEKELTQAEIAEQINSDRATVGGVIDRLIEKELIKKEIMKNDRRYYLVSISRKGLDIFKEIQFTGIESNQKATNDLSDVEITTLKKYLKTIIKNL